MYASSFVRNESFTLFLTFGSIIRCCQGCYSGRFGGPDEGYNGKSILFFSLFFFFRNKKRFSPPFSFSFFFDYLIFSSPTLNIELFLCNFVNPFHAL